MIDDAAARHLPLRAHHFHILLSLTRGPAHGYGMRREIEERTGGLLVLAAGTLYETLGRLERDGLIRETAAPDEADAGTRWRFYEATPLGHEVLRSEIERLEADLRVARARVPALV
jgi:DNA-binding PadR family transcriptional regulator